MCWFRGFPFGVFVFVSFETGGFPGWKVGYTMGRFVNIQGVSYVVVRLNFQGRSGLWSASYLTSSGSEAIGWFAASQFTDVALAPRECVRQGC